MKNWFDSKEFEQQFHTDAPLGAFCSDCSTRFALWAPTAADVTLNLYDDDSCPAPRESVCLTRQERGVWEYTFPRCLQGVYYDYLVTVDGTARLTQDPYAVACGCNGKRSMVLAPGSADPDGWQKDTPPVQSGERIIYETHIRDFSWDSAGGFPPQVKGQYRALTLNGTTLHNDGVHPTGLDYLKRLGVTHIQLLPVYDFGSVDEADPFTNYNWGYDPVNYNIPEGSYSSDPHRGEVRIRELKEMIAALHRNGFRVIMDVVYNHTYDLDSCLFKTVPWYFYRQKPDGSPSNGSGCGNDIASERSMCSRYILDSVLYWAEEFHMDGFRFDLMGLLDDSLMNRIRKELDLRYGVGEKLVYGEPWRAGNTYAAPGTVLCDKGNLKKLAPGIGAFCDDTRDAVKGSVMEESGVGFVNGGKLTEKTLAHCLCGWSGSHGSYPTANETLTYLSCHDDWTLWDMLVTTLDPERDFTGYSETVLRANRLAAAFNFCCQGNVFFLSGEELGRTKGGVKNSYRSPSEINQLDWTRAWKNRSLVDYYRGLISLRKELYALHDKKAHHLIATREFAPNCVGALLDNPGGQWTQLLVVFNCGSDPCPVSLPEGSWQVLCDAESSMRRQDNIFCRGSCSVAPVSVMILANCES